MNPQSSSEMSTNLQSGDIVRLNSGGPQMTVIQVFGSIIDPSLTVCWFDKDDQLQRAEVFSSMVTPRNIQNRPPVIPNPGESFEDAVRKRWSRRQK